MNKNKIILLLFKEKLIIILFTILGLFLAIFYLTFFYKPYYQTSATLFIKNIEKEDVVSAYGGGSIIYSESGFSNPLFNLLQILESERLLINVYYNLKEKYPEDLELLDIQSPYDFFELSKKLLNPKIKPSTDIILINFKWVKKDNTTAVLDEIIYQFKQTNLEMRKSIERDQRIFLEEQLVKISSELDEIRKKIAKFQIKDFAVNLEDEKGELVRARVFLQKETELLKTQVSYYKKKYSTLRTELDVPNAQTALRATAIGEDPYLLKLQQDLAIAEQKHVMLKAKFTDIYPDVIAAKNQIESIKKDIATRTKESLGNEKPNRGIYDQPSQLIVTDLARAQAEKDALKHQLDSMIKGVNNLINKESALPDKIEALKRLSKEEDALATAYNNIKQKQLEATIKESEIVDNIFLLNSPMKPKFLIKDLFIRFVGCIIFGFFVGFGIAYIKEDFLDRWSSSSEIELVTGKKVLGVIPWIKSKKAISRNFIEKADSIMGIAFGEITSNIVRRSYLEEAQAIAFLSTVHGRGKSSIVPNICTFMARQNKSVILVDTDFENPYNLLSIFGINHLETKKDIIDVIERINIHLRLSDVLDNSLIIKLLEEALIPIVIDSDTVFHYLCSNKRIDNINDYVSTKGFSTIITFLKQNYEFILIDTPPKSHVFPEFTSISNACDAVVIASAMQTNREGLIKIIEKYEKNNTKVLGIISREKDTDLERMFLKEAQDKELEE